MTTTSTEPADRVPEATVFSPSVDIDEGRDDIVLLADLPGVRDEDLRVTLEKKTLVIEARVAADERPAYRLAHREYAAGDFRRVFTISDDIDQGKIKASLKSGVLRLVLPKVEPARPRTITVKVG